MLPAQGPAALAGAARKLDGECRVAVLSGPWTAYEEGSGNLPPLLKAPVTVAALAGDVRGPALSLALACDLRLIEDGTGLHCAGEPTAALALAELLGHARALEIALTGRAVDAEEAVTLGIAIRRVPTGTAANAAGALADQLARAPREAASELVAVLRRASGRRNALPLPPVGRT